MSRTHHMCFTGSPSCSGCNPCEGCAHYINMIVMPRAMSSAGFNQSAEQAHAFYEGLDAGWRLFHQAMSSDPRLISQMKVTDVTALVAPQQPPAYVPPPQRQFAPPPMQPPRVRAPQQQPWEQQPQPPDQFGPPPGYYGKPHPYAPPGPPGPPSYQGRPQPQAYAQPPEQFQEPPPGFYGQPQQPFDDGGEPYEPPPWVPPNPPAGSPSVVRHGVVPPGQAPQFQPPPQPQTQGTPGPMSIEEEIARSIEPQPLGSVMGPDFVPKHVRAVPPLPSDGGANGQGGS